jgi:hypothetical protein
MSVSWKVGVVHRVEGKSRLFPPILRVRVQCTVVSGDLHTRGQDPLPTMRTKSFSLVLGSRICRLRGRRRGVIGRMVGGGSGSGNGTSRRIRGSL